MAFTNLRGGIEVEINHTFEGLAFEVDVGIIVDIEPKVNSFVDGETCDETMLMVDMRAQRANAIGGKNVIGHRREK